MVNKQLTKQEVNESIVKHCEKLESKNKVDTGIIAQTILDLAEKVMDEGYVSKNEVKNVPSYFG